MTSPSRLYKGVRGAARACFAPPLEYPKWDMTA